MTMGLTLTILSSLFLAHEISLRLWRRDERLPAGERTLYVMAIGVLLWLASAWIIAIPHLLRREVVLARTALFTLSGFVLLVRRRPKALRIEFDRRTLVLVLVALVPMVLWVDFVLWRGSICAPLNHDALSYHLPKAAMYIQAHGYESLVDLSYVIQPRPSNYELLLADAIAADGSDTYTEWPGMIFYAGLLAGGIALAQRWWQARLEALLATGLAIGAVPVALLHAGAHKNDSIFSFFAIAAIVAAGRYLSAGGTATLALVVASLAALAGTKTHGLIVGLCICPLIAWRLFRPFSAKKITGAVGIAVVSALLLGGMDDLGRFVDARKAPAAVQSTALASVVTYPYGDWSNLWQAPYILLCAPFSSDPRALSVPWLETPLFWQRYELYFSHFGIHFSIAAVLLPLVMIRLRRSSPQSLHERYALTAATFAAVVLLLPVNFKPKGLYAIYLPRFVLFIVPVVFAWTIPPLVDFLAAKRRELATAAVALASLTFVGYATSYSINDRFVPLEFVLWAKDRPGNRVIPFFPYRAPSVVDGMAGPRDTIAFDAGHAAWLYPAYGKELERRVQYIRPGTGPPVIPDVDWIVIERSWSAIWGDPDFKDLSQAREFLVRGRSQPEDRRVADAVMRDPRYKLVFNDPRLRQAVFRRIR